MLTQPESSRESEKVVLNGFNKKLAIKVKAFEEGHPGVRAFATLYLPLILVISSIKVKAWLYDADELLKKVLANPNSYGLKDNTTYGPGNGVAWCMYNVLSPRLSANDLLPGDGYHVSPPVHLEIARGVKQLLPMQLL